ncbi:MAG: hypothetical protein Q9162_004442 [Coniocarpon cinnabarinum]
MANAKPAPGEQPTLPRIEFPTPPSGPAPSRPAPALQNAGLPQRSGASKRSSLYPQALRPRTPSPPFGFSYYAPSNAGRPTSHTFDKILEPRPDAPTGPLPAVPGSSGAAKAKAGKASETATAPEKTKEKETLPAGYSFYAPNASAAPIDSEKTEKGKKRESDVLRKPPPSHAPIPRAFPTPNTPRSSHRPPTRYYNTPKPIPPVIINGSDASIDGAKASDEQDAELRTTRTASSGALPDLPESQTEQLASVHNEPLVQNSETTGPQNQQYQQQTRPGPPPQPAHYPPASLRPHMPALPAFPPPQPPHPIAPTQPMSAPAPGPIQLPRPSQTPLPLYHTQPSDHKSKTRKLVILLILLLAALAITTFVVRMVLNRKEEKAYEAGNWGVVNSN